MNIIIIIIIHFCKFTPTAMHRKKSWFWLFAYVRNMVWNTEFFYTGCPK